MLSLKYLIVHTNLWIYSYHHVLKSRWLNGKRNWCMDHLIHTLMREFLRDIEHRHKRQMLGMEGPDLAEKRRQQILMRALETPMIKYRGSMICTSKCKHRIHISIIKSTYPLQLAIVVIFLIYRSASI